jgi:SAM-dependent methyltransferase
MHGCAGCGALFTYPAPALTTASARYNEGWFLNEYLPSYGINPSAPSFDHLAQRYGAELESVRPFFSNGRLLDMGAGAGLFLFHASRNGWEPYGVDVSEYGPRYARERFGIEIFCGTLEQAHFPDRHFDAVMLQDTIEHVSDPFCLLSEINRILRPGGGLVISTPNVASLGRRILSDRWALISPAEHLCLFSARSLRAIARRTGFKVKTLSVASNVNVSLVHEDHTPRTHYRKAILKRLAKYMPAKISSILHLGDELHCTFVKQGDA